MPGLIGDLEGEHGALKALLSSISEGGMSYQEQVAMVQTTKSKLLGHLQKEDAKLYPFLQMHAENDPALAQKLSLFSNNMERVTAKVLQFYEKYENGWERKQRFIFIMDLAEVASILTRRIEVEEKSLYPEYDVRKAKPLHRTNPGVLGRLRRMFGAKEH